MKKHSDIGTVLILLGVLLIAGAGYLFFNNEKENQAAQETINEVMPALIEQLKSETVSNSDEAAEGSVAVYEGYYAVVTVKELDVQLPIYYEYSEEMMKLVPCRFEDNVFCGHNTRVQFGFLSKLKIGDQIIVNYFDGRQECYEAAAQEVIQPDDVAGMNESGYDLTLFTCTTTNEARYTVRFNKVTD